MVADTALGWVHLLVFLDLVGIATEDMVNAVTGTMATAIHSAAWDYSVGMVCTVTVDMATTTEAVMEDIILLMVISMGDMVGTLKDILSNTCSIKLMANLKSMASLKHMLNLRPMDSLQPTISLQPIINLQSILNLKLILSHRPILKRTHL